MTSDLQKQRTDFEEALLYLMYKNPRFNDEGVKLTNEEIGERFFGVKRRAMQDKIKLWTDQGVLDRASDHIRQHLLRDINNKLTDVIGDFPNMLSIMQDIAKDSNNTPSERMKAIDWFYNVIKEATAEVVEQKADEESYLSAQANLQELLKKIT